MANALPKFIEKIYERVTSFGLTVTASATPSYPSDLEHWLVPLANRLNWYDFDVS